MIKLIFICLIISNLFILNQKKDTYIYKIDNCVGLRNITEILFKDKKIGILHGVYNNTGFCFGKIEIDKGFKLIKSMTFYKIKPFIGEAYIQIEMNKSKEQKLRQKIQLQDTIKIITLAN